MRRKSAKLRSTCRALLLKVGSPSTVNMSMVIPKVIYMLVPSCVSCPLFWGRSTAETLSGLGLGCGTKDESLLRTCCCAVTL